MIGLGLVLVGLPLVIGGYAYVVYPALLRLLAPAGDDHVSGEAELPTVTITVPAYNEAGQPR